MNWETIICLGDSITFGARSYLGYPEYVGDQLSKALKKDWNVINHSTSGFMAIDLARSISNNQTNLTNCHPSISTILIGTNDIKNNTPVEDYSIALDQIILKAKLFTENQNVLLISLPEFPAGVMYPYKKEMNSLVSVYNQNLHEKAKNHKISHLEVSLPPEMFFDGVHLNNEGSLQFAKKISNFILRERGISHG